MANTKNLSVPELGEILKNHTPTGNAIRKIVDWINANVEPKQGNKITTTK